jgi:ElaB/YqjD/DUF883 family membrane-anchored ribosome-binding protein
VSDQKTAEYPGSPGNLVTVPPIVTDSTKKELGTRAGEAVSKIAEVAQQAGTQAKETATSLVFEAGENTKRLMNKQVGNSADFIGHVATSMKSAAQNLDEHAPQLAKWARDLASRADEFSASIRYQTVDQLYANAAEYTRRKPTLVFGAAAACGFLLLRLFKASPDAVASEGQTSREISSSPQLPSGSQF